MDWPGGLYAIQNQLKLDIHVGGKTALQLKGLAHFLPMELKKIFLFGSSGQKLPSWFKSYDWDVEIDYIMTNLFGNNVGLSEQDYGNFSIKVSSPERAIMEVLYSVPQKQTFGEASLLMENLISLRPRVVGELLRNANSVKVKRLFLYLTEKHGHQWIKKLDLSSVDLGKGKRVIVKGGVYNPRYRITIPG